MDFQLLIAKADTIQGFVLPNLRKQKPGEDTVDYEHRRATVLMANIGFVQATLIKLMQQPQSKKRDECFAIFKTLQIELLKEAGIKF